MLLGLPFTIDQGRQTISELRKARKKSIHMNKIHISLLMRVTVTSVSSQTKPENFNMLLLISEACKSYTTALQLMEKY